MCRNSRSLYPGASALGMGRMHGMSVDEIEHIVRHATENGISVLDLCAGGENVFTATGRAIAHMRDKVVLTAHFGAALDELGDYEWIREPERIRRSFRRQLKELGTDHIELGIVHCVDDENDWTEMRDGGVFAYMKRLRARGTLKMLGFSSHTPALALKILDQGCFDAVMINIGDEYNDGMRDALLGAAAEMI